MDKNEFLDKKEVLSKEEKNKFWIYSNIDQRISRAHKLVILCLSSMYTMYIIITICAQSRKLSTILEEILKCLMLVTAEQSCFISQVSTVVHIPVPALNVCFPAKMTKHRFYHTSYNQVKNIRHLPPFKKFLFIPKRNINCTGPKICLLPPKALLKYRQEIFTQCLFTGAYFIASLISSSAEFAFRTMSHQRGPSTAGYNKTYRS